MLPIVVAKFLSMKLTINDRYSIKVSFLKFVLLGVCLP
jgi:hypothetical protein